jgi:hypothetical protein
VIVHFTIEAALPLRSPAEGKGFEPSSRLVGNRLSRAARPTVSGYLPFQWTHRELNPDPQPAELVSSRWTMSPCCSVDVPGSRTPISWLQARRLSVGRAAHCRIANARSSKVRPGFEPGLPPYRGGVPPKTPTDRFSKMIPDGVEPSVSWVSSRRLSRWTTGSK